MAGSAGAAVELLVLPDGALEPAAAPPLGAELVDPLALVEPPAALSLSLSLSASAVAEELALLDGALLPEGALGAVLTEPEAEPEGAVDGELGVVVEPAEEDDEPAGGVVLETARSPSLSQPVSNPAPSAKDTATAKVESLICGPPWLG